MALPACLIAVAGGASAEHACDQDDREANILFGWEAFRLTNLWQHALCHCTWPSSLPCCPFFPSNACCLPACRIT